MREVVDSLVQYLEPLVTKMRSGFFHFFQSKI
jgi:hypothetical protein